jgi:hypothetical protein
MKIIHGSLSSLLTEVKEQGKVDGVRVAAMMQGTFECAGLPRYTSWVIVSAHVDWEKWAEWRLVVGRQRGEVTERGYRVPEKLAALTEERLAEVRGWIEAAGLLMRDGILAGGRGDPRGRPWLAGPPAGRDPPSPRTCTARPPTARPRRGRARGRCRRSCGSKRGPNATWSAMSGRLPRLRSR